MNYLKLFGVSTGVGVDVSNFFAVEAGAEVLKCGAGAELESEKCDSAHRVPGIEECENHWLLNTYKLVLAKMFRKFISMQHVFVGLQ